MQFKGTFAHAQLKKIKMLWPSLVHYSAQLAVLLV